MSEDILLEVRDPRGVATLTLNRPGIHNAFNDELVSRLSKDLARLAADESVRIVVVTGAGRSFSAGGDLNWMKSMAGYSEEENIEDALALAELMRGLDRFPKPTIARVNGPAFGGGVGLIACCDIAIGTPRATFALTEVKLGLAPAVIAPYVVRAIGARQSRRYFQTAEIIPPDAARALGLLHEVVAEDELDRRLAGLIDALLGAGPRALAAAKQLVAECDPAEGSPAQALKRRTAELIARLRVSAEGQEGLAAFLEKRKPAWTGGKERP